MLNKYEIFSYFLSILINLFFLLIFFSALNFPVSKENPVKIKLISPVSLISPSISLPESISTENLLEPKPEKVSKEAIKKDLKEKQISESAILKEKLSKIESQVSKTRAESSDLDYEFTEREAKELEKKILAFQKGKDSKGIQSGADLSGASVNYPGEALSLEYLLLIKRKLQNNFEIPVYLRNQRDLYALVNVELESNGKILNYQFLKKSSNSEFNRAIERCLKISSPFPVNKKVNIIVEFRGEGVGKIK